MNIFVGNLSFEAKEIDVQRAFMAFGVVTSVAIVMERKGKKSRGFGFVEMPDEQEALAAIAQLQGKEILGRPINVTPAVSKGPKSQPAGKKVNSLAPRRLIRRDGFRQENKDINLPQGFSLQRTGKYKEGRRTLSYIKKRLKAGITAPLPERRRKSNPMRWLKKPRTQARFTPKPEGELKPWQRVQTESNPWKKPRTKSGSWSKPEGESKPWIKSEGRETRPWKKTEKSSAPSRPWEKGPSSEFKPWKKTRGGAKPWIKSEGSEAKPWKKAEGSSAPSRPWKKSAATLKPWRKSSADRQQSGFKAPKRFRKP